MPYLGSPNLNTLETPHLVVFSMGIHAGHAPVAEDYILGHHLTTVMTASYCRTFASMLIDCAPRYSQPIAWSCIGVYGLSLGWSFAYQEPSMAREPAGPHKDPAQPIQVPIPGLSLHHNYQNSYSMPPSHPPNWHSDPESAGCQRAC